MKKRGKFKVLENNKIAKDVYKMVFEGNTEDITTPGQFINIELDGFYLRRPISICEYGKDYVFNASCSCYNVPSE